MTDISDTTSDAGRADPHAEPERETPVKDADTDQKPATGDEDIIPDPANDWPAAMDS